MKLFTIGCAQKSAEELFTILKNNNVQKVLDVRLKNGDCYCYYTHKRDFPFLLSLKGIKYEHKENWAPEGWFFYAFKNKKITWDRYVVEFNKLIERRNIVQGVKPEDLDGCVLLCTEVTAEMCHRRLLGKYFREKFPELQVIHL